MSNVTLEIAGRKYTIACAEGEEQHIEKLGRSIDTKLAALEGLHGQTPERVMLYASLLLADELHEASNGMAAPTPPSEPAVDARQAEVLEKLADRMEDIAMQLETGGAAS
ncbi:cell division protein ZapA [Aurantiacibacter aquimixticola]|uniref:Cell division protein ZapA n=1 Tax=Aurantiacibacter aquimixticola TaxID=1958945 RepID=A0A419RSF2_9SPHN|nr:cell division protein ZapA [Aurantiacibacter aquimixticola]RJY08710.1 cell division protein ZapA [Aurantiacibacter aquimixticola]